MIVQTFVAIAETYFFGRLGTEALAGFALVFPFMMLMTMMAAGGMGGGVAAAMARALGGKRIEDARALVLHALVLGVAFALAVQAARLDDRADPLPAARRQRAALANAETYSHVLFTGVGRGVGQLLLFGAAARRRRRRDARPLHADLLDPASAAVGRPGAGPLDWPGSAGGPATSRWSP